MRWYDLQLNTFCDGMSANVKSFLFLQTLGNHEFDDHIAGVVPFLDSIESPMLVANMDDSEEPTIQGKTQKSIIIDRYDRKIGIIGVVLSTYDVRPSDDLNYFFRLLPSHSNDNDLQHKLCVFRKSPILEN